MNIAIIGGGISGLATYLQLQKQLSQHPSLKDHLKISISIFESHDLPKHAYDISKATTADSDTNVPVPSIGGGYGLAANGMASLRRLDPAIHARILKNSFPTPRFRMMTRRGWTLGAINCVIDGEGKLGSETCCMVTREVVLQALYECVPADAIKVRKVVEVVDGGNENGKEAMVKFEDGEEMGFDLVVGADGIWSCARRAVSEGDGEGPEYRGLSTIGGFFETKYLQPTPSKGPMPYPQSQAVMTFGHNGFFGYTPCTTSPTSPNTGNTGNNPITPSHIRGDTSLPRGEMGFWWARSSAQEEPSKSKSRLDQQDLDEAMKGLAERMESWSDPNIPAILQHSVKTAMTPTYVLPRQKTWAGKRVVLVGDAAHALPTSSGQGVSQSLEDAEALAMLLVRHLSTSIQADGATTPVNTAAVFQKTFDQYMTVRKAHVERILDAGNRGGDASRDLNVVAEYTMYAFLWVMLRFFGRLFTKEVETYNVVEEVEKVLK